MKSLDFILPAKSAGAASEMETPAFSRSQTKPSEPFDQMMNRALSKPSREPAEKHSALKKPTTHPAASRKQCVAPKAETNPSSDAQPSRAEGRAADCKQDSSNDDSDSSADQDVKDHADAKTTDDNNAALQTLVAPLPVTLPVVKEISASGNSDAETGAVGIIGEGNSSPAVNGEALDSIEAPGISGKPEIKPDEKSHAGTGKKVAGGKIDPAKLAESGDGAVAVSELPGKVQPVKETAVNTEVLSPTKAHAPAQMAAGTSTAQEPPTMKNNDQSAKVAGAPEQSLPDATVVTSAAQVARSKPAAKASARVESPDAVSVTSSAASRPTSETSSGNLISASSQTEMRLRAVERTHDILALHGVQLKQTNTDSLHVVLKPGAGLQLSLQMKQTSDGIEAQAILQQGDFQDLNKHWADLQQRLEERGIRLAPLGQDNAAANSGNENFRNQSRQSFEQDAVSAGAFAEFTLASSSASKATPAMTTAARGWESWA